MEGVLPSGEIAAKSGITAAALGVGTSKYGAVATLYKLFNFAQCHQKVSNPGFGSSPTRRLMKIEIAESELCADGACASNWRLDVISSPLPGNGQADHFEKIL